MDKYETAHISSQTRQDISAAIDELHQQNLILMRAADEEQLVDQEQQEDLQKVYSRLFTVITIFEDYFKSHFSSLCLEQTSSMADMTKIEIDAVDAEMARVEVDLPKLPVKIE